MEKIVVLRSMAQVDFSLLMQVYEESVLRQAQKDFPDASLAEAVKREEENIREDCRCCFADGGRYYVLLSDGEYVSILCTEPYGDGILISALETAPHCRRKGYSRKLLLAVKEAEKGKLYSHVAKNNAASFALHKACGFSVLKDSARLIDGTVSAGFYTMVANENNLLTI